MTALAKSFEQTSLLDEHRRHGRIKVRLPGRFMRPDRKEYDCFTLDMSPGGVAFSTDEAVEPDERIVAYVEQIGRLEGRVARAFEGGFAIAMRLPSPKRERLADQITWLANRKDLGLPEDRRHERIRPRLARTTLHLPEGREILASILDISRSGVALTLNHPVTPPVGTPVNVGATPGRIVRLFADGVAVEFSRIVPEGEFGSDIRL